MKTGFPCPGMVAKKKPLEETAYENREFTGCKTVVKMLLDPRGHIIDANPDAEKVYGLPASELKGLPLTMFIHPDDLAEFKEMLGRTRSKKREELLFCRNRHVSNTGDVYFISWVTSLHYTESGDLSHIDLTATAIMPLDFTGEVLNVRPV